MPEPREKPKSLRELAQKLTHPRWGNHTVEILELGTTDHPQFIPKIAALLHERDEEVRVNAVQTLGEAGLPEALPHIIQAMKDKEFSVRSNAALQLGNFKRPTVLFPLLKALKDEYASVRSSAVQSLGKIGRRSAIPHLLNTMENDKELFVAYQAAATLAQIGQSLQGQTVKSKPAKALQLVAPHFRQNEDPRIVRTAYHAALAGKITPANARLYIKQLRAMQGSVK